MWLVGCAQTLSASRDPHWCSLLKHIKAAGGLHAAAAVAPVSHALARAAAETVQGVTAGQLQALLEGMWKVGVGGPQ